MQNYLFVFNKPLEVTDVQVHELRSLLKNHGDLDRVKIDNADPQITFHEAYSVRKDEYTNGLSHINRLPITGGNCGVMYLFEQSCLLSVNNPLSSDDLSMIVGNSGYIHSAGDVVHAGKWDNAEMIDILDNVKSKLSKKKGNVEFWTDANNVEEDLSGLSIDSKRYFIDNLPFESQAKKVYGLGHTGNISEKVAIFKDTYHDPSDNRYPESGDSVFMMAYVPRFKKFSPLQILDEGKPYWKGIDTTPQNLMAAMLNIVGLKENGTYMDTFGGMGTCMIEATKVMPKRIIHNDIMETIGAEDNYRILASNSEDIDNISQDLKDIVNKDEKAFKEIIKIAESGLDWTNVGKTGSYPEIIHVDNLIGQNKILKTLESRALFYMARRSLYRGKDDHRAFVNERIDLLEEYADNIRKVEKNDYGIWMDEGVRIVPSLPRKNDGWQTTNIDMGVLQDQIAKSSIDGIATDMPYGYGTDANPSELVELYKSMISNSLELLKPGGSLSLCVLDKVRTGKPVNPRLTTEGVLDIIESQASKLGIGFSFDDLSYNGTKMYWKSGKKLNRGIINIKVSK